MCGFNAVLRHVLQVVNASEWERKNGGGSTLPISGAPPPPSTPNHLPTTSRPPTNALPSSLAVVNLPPHHSPVPAAPPPQSRVCASSRTSSCRALLSPNYVQFEPANLFNNQQPAMLQQTTHTLDDGGFVSANIVRASTAAVAKHMLGVQSAQNSAAALPQPAAAAGGYGESKKKDAVKPSGDVQQGTSNMPQQLASGGMWHASMSQPKP